MNPSDSLAIVLHDAPCLMCRASMRWLRDTDRHHRFYFVALDSDEGRDFLFDAGLEPHQADSVVVLHDGRAYRYSNAVAYSLRLLGGKWAVLGTLLGWVPAPLRDAGYRIVARHRHLWPFGGACEVPDYSPSALTREVSTLERSMRNETPSGSTSSSGEASRSSKPAIESTTTTGRDDSE
jgi:predicted DCC family thiol-disulfide oxidoreductase YuxK